MNMQIITSPSGERLVVLPEIEYVQLLDALEDIEDAAAAREVLAKLTRGEEELIPDGIVDRLLSGESKIKIWREHRGLSITDLAAAAGLSQPYMSQIESGARKGRKPALEAIAAALKIDLEDLVS